MNAVHSKMQRPQRWDQSFDPDLTDQDVQWLLTLEPFRSMNAAENSGGLPLRGILAHDCRLLDLQKGDIILSFGGTDIKELRDLTRAVATMPPEAKTDVVVLRKGKEQTLAVTVGALKQKEA